MRILFAGGAGYIGSVVTAALLDAVREVIGQPVPVVVGERRAGDPAQLVASSDRIRADLGWAPRHTDMAGIVRDAWETARKHT